MTTDALFGPFRLHSASGRLLRGEHPVPLGPKAFELLRYLAHRPGNLISKHELLENLWPGTHVTGEALRVCIREVRKALGDDARAPRYIETAHRRGYRFIATAPVSGLPASGAGEADRAGRGESAAADPIGGPAGRIVGRREELVRLRSRLLEAARMTRRVVFISGEPGIGKTATLEAFLEEASALPGLLIARGQCLEQYGSGEAYLPVLDALGRIGRGPDGGRLAATLRRCAPTWLAHLPALVEDEHRERLQRETLGATSGRMLREIAEAIEAITSDRPMVMALEDLHWSDYSTLDLISFLASRREPARLMLVGTYRDIEVRLNRHPLRAVQQELLARGLCERLRLGLLPQEAVREYLKERFPSLAAPGELSRAIHRRTDGNPLFLVNLVAWLESRGLMDPEPGHRPRLELLRREIARGVPDSLRQLIQKQIDRLDPEERSVLEAASAASLEFSALAVAAALEDDERRVERVCERLAARGHFLRPAGIRRLPDGTLSPRFSFIHSLYQNVLHESTQPSRRLRLHQRIARRGVSVYGERAGEIAAELAMHFEQAGDREEAVLHLRTAAATACRRRAWREAIDHLRRARGHLRRLPAARRPACRILILEQLGTVRRSMGDMAGAAGDFLALAAAARGHGDVEAQARGLLYLASARSWSDGRRSLAAARRAVALSGRLEDADARARVRSLGGYWHTLRGWTDEAERACARTIAQARRVDDTAVLSQHLVRHALFECLQAGYDEAALTAREGLTLAVAVNEVFDHLLGRFFLGWALLHAGRWDEAGRAAAEGIRMAEQIEHRPWKDLFLLLAAWLHREAFDDREGVRLCEPALARDREAGFPVGGIMAAALLGGFALDRGNTDEARRRFDDVLRACRQPVVMGWYWEMQCRLGLAEAWLLESDPRRSREQEWRVIAVASGPGEATLLARAWAVSASAALAAGALDAARADLGRALDLIRSRPLPLAEWRVAESAAQVAEARGDASGPHRERAAAVLRRLAGSLRADDRLRISFLAHPRVQALLAGADAAARAARRRADRPAAYRGA